MTANRVALIDWDESHVDVPDLDLVLPRNAAGLDGAVPALVDPGTMVVWEMRLDDVTVGKANFRAIIDEIAGEADRLIRVLQQHSAAPSTWASLSAPKAGGPGSGAGHSMSGGEPQLPLAPCVLIEETAADVEIFVIAGWQAGQFVLGKPLREGDQSGSRSPPSTDSAGWGIPNEVRQAMLTIAI